MSAFKFQSVKLKLNEKPSSSCCTGHTSSARGTCGWWPRIGHRPSGPCRALPTRGQVPSSTRAPVMTLRVPVGPALQNCHLTTSFSLSDQAQALSDPLCVVCPPTWSNQPSASLGSVLCSSRASPPRHGSGTLLDWKG